MRNAKKKYGAIGDFIPNDTLRKLAQRFKKHDISTLDSIMYGGRSDLKFNDCFLQEFPNTKDIILETMRKKHPTISALGPGEEYEIKSSAFERTPFAFSDIEPKDSQYYYGIIGLEKSKRVQKWIKKKYLSPRFPNNNNINKWKVYISKADGAAGQIGKPVPARIIGKPSVAGPGSSFVPTFISIGSFDTELQAINAGKYLKTRFARALIGILKVTQDITPEKCKYVPLQDFSSDSDIKWSKSIAEIDRQLFAKYDLDEDEIMFIETYVKEMN